MVTNFIFLLKIEILSKKLNLYRSAIYDQKLFLTLLHTKLQNILSYLKLSIASNEGSVHRRLQCLSSYVQKKLAAGAIIELVPHRIIYYPPYRKNSKTDLLKKKMRR